MTTEELIEYLKQHPGKEVFVWVVTRRCYMEVIPEVVELVEIKPGSGTYRINQIRNSKSAIEAIVL